MRREERKICYDEDLQIEAYRFHGIMQKFPNHFHEYYVIGFIESGQRKLTCRNKDYVINSGDLIFFNPFDNHACEQMDDEPLDYRCLNITPEVMRKVVEEITGKDYLPSFKGPVAFRSEHAELLQRLHQMIMAELGDLEKEETFYFLMEQLIEEYSAIEKNIKLDKMAKEISKVCEFIERHYVDPISLDDLVAVCNMNKYTLLRSFARICGITPYRYLQTVRINKAKKLLEQGMKPTDVAAQTGFVDQSHFSHYFMDFIGLTPGQYRNIYIDSVN
ncbi:AraC family transcriptional regulator [Niallia circulans]|uniref:AraC family ligand binding domain-containing protein n=1 Tax=Niallia circulans TaxID=1397 RepID=UPI0015601806|nr:AraC family transcriptional regulator [Niallia circulans]NRG34334.1 AraC family transcriptional regulator [Niallia circulans]